MTRERNEKKSPEGEEMKEGGAENEVGKVKA